MENTRSWKFSLIGKWSRILLSIWLRLCKLGSKVCASFYLPPPPATHLEWEVGEYEAGLVNEVWGVRQVDVIVDAHLSRGCYPDSFYAHLEWIVKGKKGEGGNVLCRNEALLSLVVVRRYFFSRIRTDPDPNLHSFNEICLKTKKSSYSYQICIPFKVCFYNEFALRL